MEYLKKSFSVGLGSKNYRDNWGAVFGKGTAASAPEALQSYSVWDTHLGRSTAQSVQAKSLLEAAEQFAAANPQVGLQQGGAVGVTLEGSNQTQFFWAVRDDTGKMVLTQSLVTSRVL